MGIFSALNPFEKASSQERLTERELKGVFTLLAETDEAVTRVELARDRKLAAEGLQAPAEMAIAHTPEPESTAAFIDRMVGFETPPTAQPDTTMQSAENITPNQPVQHGDMAADARRQITEIFGASAMPDGNLTGAYDDQKAA